MENGVKSGVCEPFMYTALVFESVRLKVNSCVNKNKEEFGNFVTNVQSRN